MVWSGSRPACLPLPFICLPVLSYLSQAGCLWSGSRLACLPLPFICLPLLSLVSQFFSLVSQARCLWLGSRRLVSHFLSFVSHFFSSPRLGACLPLPFICLPGSELVVGFPAGLSPTSFHLSPTSFLVVVGFGFQAGLSPTSSYLSPTSFHLSPFSVGHVAFLFICLPGLSLPVSALFRWPCSISIHLPGLSLLVSALVRWPCCISIHVSQACHWWCPPFAAGHVAFLFFCLPGLSLVCPCLLAMKHFYSFVSQVRHCWCHVAFLFICLSGLSLVVFPCISIHLFPGSVTGAALFRCFYSFVSHVCHCYFRWPCSISIHLSPRLVTGGARPFPLFLFICLPGLSLLVSALFRWPCSISNSFVSQVCHCQCPLFSAGHAAFLFISQVCHCWCPPSVAMQHFYSCVSQACHWWCPPFAAGHVAFLFFCRRSVAGVSLSIGHEAFLFICLPGPSLLVPCSISIHLSFRSVTGGVRPYPLAMKHFYSFVSQVRYCCCPPFSVGHVAFLFICLPGLSLLVSALFVGHAAFLFISLPGLSLLVSALFRWRCNISIHLFSRSVTAGVRPFPLGMQHVYSFVSRVCHWRCRPFLRWPCSISIHLSPM